MFFKYLIMCSSALRSHKSTLLHKSTKKRIPIEKGQLSKNVTFLFRYLDPFGGAVVRYDHVRGNVVGTRPIAGELDPEYEPFRQEMQNQAIGYCKEYYPLGATTVYSSRNDNSIIICISSAKYNPDNCW